jgi:DedD protein
MAHTTQDTEITLGTGRMLTLFFVLVFTWATFFAVGFSLGRKAGSGQDHVASAQGASPAAGARPSPAKNDSPQQQSSNFSFYKAVEQKNADAQLTSAQDTNAQSASSHGAGDSSEATSPSNPQASSSAGAYYVQVAAVSRKEDAESLVEALKKKQYPAFTSNNSASDKFFHVQVGPFTDIKDAETMRGRLVGDGYNPIVKK